jgi:hypothetical protein
MRSFVPIANNNTPAANSPWLATFPRSQAASFKRQATSVLNNCK